MIQFNLLPDVKIKFIKAQRMKRMVMTIAVIASAVSLFIMTSLFLLINVAQKQHLADLSKDIEDKSKTIQKTESIGQILTIQNQLQSLDQAHDKKPVASRLGGYIEAVTPDNVSVSKLEVKFIDTTMEISGKADQLANINKFVDTLKFTTYRLGPLVGTWEKNKTYKQGEVAQRAGIYYEAVSEHKSGSDSEPGIGKDAGSSWRVLPSAFSKVVLDAFEKTETGITYTIKLNFDPTIFDTKSDTKIVVPNITTNRSATQKPSALFEASPLPKAAEEEDQ